jgi:hypothetical protein
VPLAARPVRPQQRHDQFIAVDTSEKRAASSKAFGPEADRFIGPTCSVVLRKNPKPNPMSIGLSENVLNERT